MVNEYIGVFDSGLGGLTAVKEIMREMPNQPIIYFGDTGRVPYGTRGKETIIKYVKSDIAFLKSFGVRAIVVACGTASSVALPFINESDDIPIIGVVEAAVNKAIKLTNNKKIGIIGTPGTIKSGAYKRLISEYDNSIVTISNACPLFVPLVENGYFNNEVTRLVIKEYLSQIKSFGVDTLILGCTHYPLLKKAIGEFMGDNVCLVDPGAEVAGYLKKMNLYTDSKTADNEKYRFYVSDNIEGFEELGGTFLQQEIIGQVKKIDIEKY